MEYDVFMLRAAVLKVHMMSAGPVPAAKNPPDVTSQLPEPAVGVAGAGPGTAYTMSTN